jgi:ATP-dependent Clp protease ATP-binding subunit ClpA
VELSARYINDRKLPDKAIDVIDEVGAMQMLVPPSKRKKTITAREIEAVIATMARIPPKSVSSDDKKVLEHLERDLKRLVFGQDKAIEVLSSAMKLAAPACAIRTSRSARSCSAAPPASARPKWRAAGPDHGHRAAALRHVRIHGAPFGQPPDRRASGLCRLRPGRSADRRDRPAAALRAAARRDREGAPDLFNILLQVMDNGRLTDHHGKTVDFRNVILIMTTNAGASDMAKQGIGFGDVSKADAGDEAVKNLFTPNSATASMRSCPSPTCRPKSSAAWWTSSSCSSNCSWRNRTSHPVRRRRPRLAGEEGLRPALWRAADGPLIQERVKKPLAEELLFGKLANGGEVHVSLKDEAGTDGALSFELTPAAPKLVKKERKGGKSAGTAPEPSADEAE